MTDDELDTEWIIQYLPPVPRQHLDAVQDILRARKPFVSGVLLGDPYDVVSYLPRQTLGKEEFCLLVDRNVVSRWIGLVRGQRVTAAHQHAAAIMAFAHCADLLVEPTLAFYEVQPRCAPEELQEEIDAFYTAEEASSQAWADIALGLTSVLPLPPTEKRRPRQRHDLTVPLYRWRRCYILALKVAEIHLQGGSPEGQMSRLIDWMYHDFLIGAPAVQLASRYFAPGAPRKKLLKSIESPDRARALRGIRNAAWDMTLISEWLHRVSASAADPHEKRNWTLCTLDDSVVRMAAGAVSYDEYIDELSLLERTFAAVWDPDAASRLAMKLHRYQQDSTNPARYLNQDPHANAIDGFIATGEAAVMAWSPRRGSA